MEDINESIARAIGTKHEKHPTMPLARDCMTRRLITFRPDQPVRDVVKILLAKNISGGPVVEGENLVGMISELDCMRALAGTAYEGYYSARDRFVRDEMSKEPLTIRPEDNVYTMAHMFETHSIRRLPVLEEGRLVGQVSRRDVLRAIMEGER